jgi:hypothetical protein
MAKHNLQLDFIFFIFLLKRCKTTFREDDLQGRQPPGKTTQSEEDFENWK